MTDYCTEDAEVAYPGAPPFPVAFMMGMTTKGRRLPGLEAALPWHHQDVTTARKRSSSRKLLAR